MNTVSGPSSVPVEDYLFVCEAEGAEHWPKHDHGPRGRDPCPNDEEPCGYCGSPMTRFPPDDVLSIEITMRELRAHQGHALTVRTEGAHPALQCNCGKQWA